MQTATKIPLVVIGPNLLKQDLGQFHVHAAGCADIERDPKRYGYKQAGPHMTLEAASRDEVGDWIYDDHIAEGSMEPGEGTSDCHFAPCVRFHDSAPEPTAEHKISWWVYETPGGELIRHAASHRGQWPGFEAKCSCGWETHTGGATRTFIKRAIADHKIETAA